MGQTRRTFKRRRPNLKRCSHFLVETNFPLAFDRERNSLLQNAAITPYETRELLKEYLESLSSRFKVGFLFGAKKTAEENEKDEKMRFPKI